VNPSPDPVLATIALAHELDGLHELLVTLALSALEACAARNWLRSARELLCDGELGAAQFQKAAVSRKLARRRPAEGPGNRTGVVLSPSTTIA
jgi:hypothetical protein